MELQEIDILNRLILKNSFVSEGDSPLQNGVASTLPQWTDSSAYSALKGRDCSSSCPFSSLFSETTSTTSPPNTRESELLSPLFGQTTATASPNIEGDEPLNKNLWDFVFWSQIQKEFKTVERLYAALQDLSDHIRNLKEKYREEAKDLSNLQVERNDSSGISGSYFLVDEEGNRKYLIKPLDEEAGCINSPYYPSVFVKNPFRDHVPLYLSSMREVLAYRVAELIGVGSIVPKTTLSVVTSDLFHELSDSIASDERKRFEEMCGISDKEKLCSAQEYVPNAKSLFEALQEFQMSSLSDEEIAKRFDDQDFEDMNILIWTTYDTDAHMGNILVYSKTVDAVGNEVLGLKKIDNGLAFPDKNEQLRNNLSFLPNAQKELSERAKAKILAIDPDLLAEEFEKMGMESAIYAMRERLARLKELCFQEGLSIKTIDKEMSILGKKK